jgi:hypothetical protein
VATYSTGVTATFGSTTFAEVTDLAWSYCGAPPKGRSVVWTDDAGSVTLTCLGSAGMSTANYGLRNDLTISGGGAGLTCKAVYIGLNVSPELNGVTRYSVTFKILDG